MIPGHQSDRWYGSARNPHTSARGASSSRDAVGHRSSEREELGAAEHALELVAALASSSSSMRVCVGSPGTFSTLKCRSATVAICGRCVIVTTCARSASRRSVSATACAVVPPMPASISSNTIVSPPATAAIASAMRDSSPPDAVSATGPNGRPGFGRIRNATSSAPVAPGSRSVQHDLELAVAEADPAQLRRDRGGERLRGRCRAARSSAWIRATSASARRSVGFRGLDGVVALVERRQLVPRLLAALEQLRVRLDAVPAA